MTDPLELRLREIAEHKYLSLTFGNARVMAMARAILAYRKAVPCHGHEFFNVNRRFVAIDAELAPFLVSDTGTFTTEGEP